MLRILLSVVCLAATVVDAGWFENCDECVYYNGIGYVASTHFCEVYYMCIRDPYDDDKYTQYIMCCPPGLQFDEEHNTCDYVDEPRWCVDRRERCPNTTISDDGCPYYADPYDNTAFIFSTGARLNCPKGQVWEQELCSCQGVSYKECDKLLSFEFDGSYDSLTCGTNFAKGVPYNDPSLDGDVLCLNGYQFLSIGFLNGWFAWNPLGKSYTMCFWFYTETEKQTAGLVSTNCKKDEDGSVAEFCLDRGELIVRVGREYIQTDVYPTLNEWHRVCLAFYHGYALIYYDGELIDYVVIDSMPVNSQVATTIGYVQNKPMFVGYIDDFCFWPSFLSSDTIKECYDQGPSNELYQDGDY